MKENVHCGAHALTGRAGVSKCGARLEALMRAPLSGVCRTFLGERHVIKIEIRWCEREVRGMTHFHLSSINVTDNAVTPNKCMSCYVQCLQRWDIWCSATAHTELKFCSNSNRFNFRCRVYQQWAIYRFTIWQYSFAGEIKKTSDHSRFRGKLLLWLWVDRLFGLNI